LAVWGEAVVTARRRPGRQGAADHRRRADQGRAPSGPAVHRHDLQRIRPRDPHASVHGGLIDFKHGAGKGREIRQLIARSEGKAIPRGAGKPDKEFYETFWDAMFDEYDSRHLNSPEGIQRVL
jgi:hypothetical protein